MSDDPEAQDSPASPPSKLTVTKERWAQEGRFLKGRAAHAEAGRLPPGQHLVKNWPVLDLGLHPEVSRERWKLRVFGAVEKPTIWDWAAFEALPQSEITTDIHCVTTWSRYDNLWSGVLTRNVMAAVRPKDEARFVLLGSSDGYTTNLPLADFAAADAMLVRAWEGRPLDTEHGGPVRLVVPHLYFWKSAKWLNEIQFTTHDRPGFWEVRGYHERGDPWQEQRYSDE